MSVLWFKSQRTRRFFFSIGTKRFSGNEDMRGAQGTRARYGQQVALLALPATAIVLLACRISIGVGHSDESCCLSFVDGWLKTDIAAGKATVVHQAAALPVHPFARAYALLRGGTDKQRLQAARGDRPGASASRYSRR